MNRFALSIIAMVTMLLDHIGWYFIPNPMTLTWIGRIAFPLYAFMLAESFLIIHSDSARLKKHIALLLILAFIAEPGYDLMDLGLNFSEYFDTQNNLFTLLMGYVGMMVT